jgi:uncharacterized protein
MVTPLDGLACQSTMNKEPSAGTKPISALSRGLGAMVMNWHELLFMHWPLPVSTLRPLIPAELEVDTFNGQAWIGVTPFRMTGVRPRFTPPVPGLSAFPELNVRTYVKYNGRSGVWFFSLDAANAIAVRAARVGFHLPYQDAQMTVTRSQEWIHYHSLRRKRETPRAEFHARYRPVGPVYLSVPGSADHFLTERYSLFSSDGRTLYRVDIGHEPWSLQRAEVEVEVNTMAAPLGIQLPRTPHLLHYSEKLHVVASVLSPA